MSVRRVDYVDEGVDYSILKFLILELLAEDESFDKEVNFCLVAFSIIHVLRAEYAAPIQLLDVE